jgi:hypothetical protein
MIASAEFENIPLFAGVEEQEQRRLARRAADIPLERDANGYICTGSDIQTWPLDREPFALKIRDTQHEMRRHSTLRERHR